MARIIRYSVCNREVIKDIRAVINLLTELKENTMKIMKIQVVLFIVAAHLRGRL